MTLALHRTKQLFLETTLELYTLLGEAVDLTAKREWLRKQYEEKVIRSNIWYGDWNDYVDEVFNVDPTKTKSYASWIIKRETEGTLLKEDYDKVTEYLSLFEKGKRLLPQNKRDIMAYKSPAELFTTLKQFGLVESGGRSDIVKLKELVKSGDLEFTGENEDWYGFKILTKKGSCAIGKGTEWCTAKYAEDDPRNMFERYNDLGPLYVAINKHEGQKPERIQINLETDSFMDENDQSIIHEPVLDENDHKLSKALMVKNLRKNYKSALDALPEVNQRLNEITKDYAWIQEQADTFLNFYNDLFDAVDSFIQENQLPNVLLESYRNKFIASTKEELWNARSLVNQPIPKTLVSRTTIIEDGYEAALLSIQSYFLDESAFELVNNFHKFIGEVFPSLLKKHNLGMVTPKNEKWQIYLFSKTENLENKVTKRYLTVFSSDVVVPIGIPLKMWDVVNDLPLGKQVSK